MSAAVILLAAGSGVRFGAKKPKQFSSYFGEPLLLRSFKVFLLTPGVQSIVVVASPAHVGMTKKALSKVSTRKYVSVVPGGTYRGESVRNGFLSLQKKHDVVLIHDAARPNLTQEIVLRAYRAANEHGVSLVAWPLSDTLKVVGRENQVQKTLPREALWLAQTPQAFRWAEALKCLPHPSSTATDDVSLAERKKIPVKVVKGALSNIKVTYPSDLVLAKVLAEI